MARLAYSTDTVSARRHVTAVQGIAAVAAAGHGQRRHSDGELIGYCTACGSVEVSLNRVTRRTSDGTPSGHGCEVCD